VTIDLKAPFSLVTMPGRHGYRLDLNNDYTIFRACVAGLVAAVATLTDGPKQPCSLFSVDGVNVRHVFDN
jgi:hypothetical protein